MKIINSIAIRPVLSENSIRRRATLDVVRRVFESASIEFIDENGGGSGRPSAQASAGQTNQITNNQPLLRLPQQ